MKNYSKKHFKTNSGTESQLIKNSIDGSKNSFLNESIQLDRCWRNNPHVPDSEYYSHEN